MVKLRGLTALALALATSGCPKETRQEPVEVVTPATGGPAPAQSAGEKRMPESIGVATMEPDGTIVLDLRATGPGLQGDARIRYAKGDKDYDSVLEHIGGLSPGQSKPVPPWPDDE